MSSSSSHVLLETFVAGGDDHDVVLLDDYDDDDYGGPQSDTTTNVEEEQNTRVGRYHEAGLYGQWYDPTEILDALVQDVTNHNDDDDGSTGQTTQDEEDPLVGQPTIPTVSQSQQHICQSIPYTFVTVPPPPNQQISTTPTHEIPFQIHTTISGLRIRWIDQNCQTRSSHTWNIHDSSSSKSGSNSGGSGDWLQYVKPGDLFVLSVVVDDDHVGSGERLLGGYRPLRTLPSGGFLTIKISQRQPPFERDDDNLTKDTTSTMNLKSTFVCETVYSDPYDILCLAASELDPITHQDDQIGTNINDRGNRTMTIKLMTTIVKNMNQYGLDNDERHDKYKRLRLSNPKIQQYIVSSNAAMKILQLIGFERQQQQQPKDLPHNDGVGGTEEPLVGNESESYLIAVTPMDDPFMLDQLLTIRQQALEILNPLFLRSQPTFIRDLAVPTPWESAQPRSSSGEQEPNGSGRNNNNNNTSARMGFITDEERWRRAGRVAALRRSGRGRRPNPGEAPSSRGKWGR